VIEVERKKLFGFKGGWEILVTTADGAGLDVNVASADLTAGGRLGNLKAGPGHRPRHIKLGDLCLHRRRCLVDGCLHLSQFLLVNHRKFPLARVAIEPIKRGSSSGSIQPPCCPATGIPPAPLSGGAVHFLKWIVTRP